MARNWSNQNPNTAFKTQTGNNLKLKIVKIQGEHTVNIVSSSFPKFGNLAKSNLYKHKVKLHRNCHQNRQERATTELTSWNGQWVGLSQFNLALNICSGSLDY